MSSKNASGLTLVEIVVTLGILSILIGLIGPLFDLYLSNLSTLAQTTQSGDLQAASRSMENSLNLAHKFSYSTEPVASPLGANNNTAPWLSTGSSADTNVFVAKYYALDTPSRTATERNLLKCNGALVENMLVFFVKDSTLYRRTIAGSCSTPNPALRSTCTAGFVGGACASTDAVLLRNVNKLKFNYFDLPNSTTPITITPGTEEAVISSSKTITVTLGTQVQINGKMNVIETTFRLSKFNQI